MIAFDTTQVTSAGNYSRPRPGDPCRPLAAGAHPPAVAFAWQGGDGQTTLGYDPDSDTSMTLVANQVPAVAFSSKDCGADAGDIAPTLRAMSQTEGYANGGGQVAVAFGIGSDAIDRSGEGAAGTAAQRAGLNIVEDCQPTLRARPNNSVATARAVRRLTPREAERLQGFPDDWTLVPYRGKPAADGPRYRAIGNSMAVPVMRWIGERIQMVEGRFGGD